MDDKTRGVGEQDDLAGRADETTRNLDSTASSRTSRVQPPRPPATPARTRSTTPAAGSTARAASSPSDPAALDAETDQRTRQIQAEIAETREELSETIDAIQEKLRPSNLMSEATEKVKSATTERVRHMTESANETAQEMMRSSRHTAAGVVETARQNPIPALMIGVGVAWLLMDRSKDSSHSRSRYRGSSAGRIAPSGRYDTPDRYYRSQYVAEGTGLDFDESEYGSDDSYDYRSSNRGLTRGVQDLGSRASNVAGDAGESLRRTSRQAQNGLQRLLRDNPLLVGAAAIVAGAAVGAALPETERENEIMGETRDSMIEQAQDMARNIPNTVQQVAADTVTKVAEKVTSGE